MISAEVVCDSISDQGKRLTTFRLRYPKFIHGEFMTHRKFSRNASSSRAIPVKRLIQEVRDDALRATFVFWGKNQSGMQAAEELTDVLFEDDHERGKTVSLYEQLLDPKAVFNPLCFVTPMRAAKALWRTAALHAAEIAEEMDRIGAHKQIVNRLLEPFSHINVVATATEWDNFFGLRLHKDAQPEMRALAEAMWEARKTSTPGLLKSGEWHTPFADDDETDLEMTEWLVDHAWGNGDRRSLRVHVSVARCAHVSFEDFETGKRMTVDKCLRVYDKLTKGLSDPTQPLHASPMEHQATPDEFTPRDYVITVPKELTEKQKAEREMPVSVTLTGEWSRPQEHGNFVGWRQYRKMLPGEAVAPLLPGY